ncbi:hypothetical protein SPTER_32770 [Sporomusa termitida]|uniref:Uncharacterized protein n=1 Tax=Sporomusa termitida TaxID=2377 RepID=A0A517DWX5_9FIRM|nr:hypothetical protein SPTER_32770 [Sporomusa termitida]
MLSGFENWSTNREELMDKTKSFVIPREAVKQAYEQVKANKGSAGIRLGIGV